MVNGVTNIIFSSCVWCGKWTIHSSLSCRTIDNGVSMQVFFFFFFLQGGEGVKAKSSQ